MPGVFDFMPEQLDSALHQWAVAFAIWLLSPSDLPVRATVMLALVWLALAGSAPAVQDAAQRWTLASETKIAKFYWDRSSLISPVYQTSTGQAANWPMVRYWTLTNMSAHAAYQYRSRIDYVEGNCYGRTIRVIASATYGGTFQNGLRLSYKQFPDAEMTFVVPDHPTFDIACDTANQTLWGAGEVHISPGIR
jgi:hypothetical protein